MNTADTKSKGLPRSASLSRSKMAWLLYALLVIGLVAFIASRPFMDIRYEGTTIRLTLVEHGSVDIGKYGIGPITAEIGGYWDEGPADEKKGFMVFSGDHILRGEIIPSPLGAPSVHDYLKTELPSYELINQTDRDLSVILTAEDPMTARQTQDYTYQFNIRALFCVGVLALAGMIAFFVKA